MVCIIVDGRGRKTLVEDLKTAVTGNEEVILINPVDEMVEMHEELMKNLASAAHPESFILPDTEELNKRLNSMSYRQRKRPWESPLYTGTKKGGRK